ncbi:type IV toxin-antitoxin system AbiEi family antitoxin domain-containing protein [Thalassotalea fusca]
MSSKLQWINSELSQYDLLLSSYLSRHEIMRSHVQNYLKSGWLESFTQGVYKKPKQVLSWSSALSAVQFQLDLPVHLAGASSLAQQGISHYLSFNNENIQVNATSSLRLPKWLTDSNWSLSFKTSKVLDGLEDNDLTEMVVNNQTIKASTIELAVLEVLENVNDESSFTFAAELFQGLTSLRPRRLQSLLERSKAIKVKRLFLFLAHYYHHPWLKRLNETKIDLGSGKRQIVKGGTLDKKYLITVPSQFQLRAQIDG